ncbi:LAMI_0G17524g1_1 [Lachancea mirantina]|uniref:Protein transport protein BOS1 n=1 Tax=Lachancea mirantina TaxID=1230905 RepID=A0A1G4KD39_9SACH|nr:LAMI_0G17524g1_1 [Lachancea mirantina]
MNALYNHALKQKALLHRDLARFDAERSTAPISLQGSISASLISLEKTLSQYRDQFTKYQASKVEDDEETEIKYQNRLNSLQSDYEDAKRRFEELRTQFNETNAREQLLKSSSNPFDEGSFVNRRNIGTSANPGADAPQIQIQRDLYSGLQREQSIFERGNAQLDYILEMGQQSLEDIIEQNTILQKAQQQMTKTLHTLGVSDQTINSINRRVFKDKIIFWISLILLLLGFYFVTKLFR